MVYTLSPKDRRLKHLSLPLPLKARLARWTEGGQYGHVFDNERDTIRFTHFQTFEFQGMEKATDLLVALCFYVTHRFDAVVYDPAAAARVKLLAIDEGWRWMLHGDMGAYMVEKLKTGRKHNLCNLFVTQSALDAERAGFGELLNEACPTKMFFANPEIRPETYETVYQLNPKQALRVSQLRPRRELAIFASDPERPTYKQFKVVKLVIEDAETVLAYSNDPNANRTKFNRTLGASVRV
jgi:type IV secretory pathway VirB4 component